MLNPNLDFMILFGTHSCGFQIRKASVHCVMTSQFVVKLWTIRESIRYSFFGGLLPRILRSLTSGERGSGGDKPPNFIGTIYPYCQLDFYLMVNDIFFFNLSSFIHLKYVVENNSNSHLRNQKISANLWVHSAIKGVHARVLLIDLRPDQ